MKKLNAKLPDSPGVYFFRKGREILYIGKATSLRDRVRSYFNHRVISERGPGITQMVELATKILFRKTDSVLEALILEAELIKKYKPKYNTKEKDDKSFNYVVITDEIYPRVMLVRGKNLSSNSSPVKIKYIFGPYPHGAEIKEALRIVRKIFPFRDKCIPVNDRPCFNRQIGLCPGVCSGEISETDYRKQISQIKLFFEGKKMEILRELKREMKKLAEGREFEKASLVRNKIFAFEHIMDVTLLKRETTFFSSQKGEKVFRIEGYDAAHLAGSNAVGVMVVVENGEPSPSEYRKFKLRGPASKESDADSLKEILIRRMNHPEWRFPDLVIVDGGKIQVNTATQILKNNGFSIPVIGVFKDEHHRPKGYIGDGDLIKKYESEILLVNSLAHHFAIGFHKKLRDKIK